MSTTKELEQLIGKRVRIWHNWHNQVPRTPEHAFEGDVIAICFDPTIVIADKTGERHHLSSAFPREIVMVMTEPEDRFVGVSAQGVVWQRDDNRSGNSDFRWFTPGDATSWTWYGVRATLSEPLQGLTALTPAMVEVMRQDTEKLQMIAASINAQEVLR